MAALNPALSSSLANDVYGISKLPDLRRAVQQLKIDYNDKFVFQKVVCSAQEQVLLG